MDTDPAPFTSARGSLVVVCKGDQTLILLEQRSLSAVRRIRLTAIGHEVIVDADRLRAFVPLFGTGGVGRAGESGDGIDVVDLLAGAVVETIPLPSGHVRTMPRGVPPGRSTSPRRGCPRFSPSTG